MNVQSPSLGSRQRLVVEHLSKYYGERKVVDSLSFTLEPGEVLGLLGPNGAGKTTAVEMMYGAVHAHSGTSRLLPKNIDSFSAEAMRHIGVVTQINNLDPDFDVENNLLLFGRYHGLSKSYTKQRCELLLGQLELEEYAQHSVEQLSGGLERRVVLARALVPDPQFIFLDEPTTGFDPDVRQLFWRSILSLRDQGKSILLTTHYMDEAQRLCDRLVVLQEGTVQEHGSPNELIKRLIGEQVLEVEGISEEAIRSVIPNAELFTFARGFISPLDSLGAKNFSALKSLGARSISLRNASLEDVFIALQQRSRNNSAYSSTPPTIQDLPGER